MLCTSDKTFALKLVETTNTLLLMPPQEVRGQIERAVAAAVCCRGVVLACPHLTTLSALSTPTGTG